VAGEIDGKTLNASRDHHFVPKLLLRPWLVDAADGQRALLGYWWDSRTQKLAVKRKGLEAFCFQLDLLTLASHHLGRDALERVFLVRSILGAPLRATFCWSEDRTA